MVTGQNPATVAAARRELPEGVVVVQADARILTDTDRVATRRSFMVMSTPELFDLWETALVST